MTEKAKNSGSTEKAKNSGSTVFHLLDGLVNVYAVIALVAESWYSPEPLARVLALGFLLSGFVALRIGKAVVRTAEVARRKAAYGGDI